MKSKLIFTAITCAIFCGASARDIDLEKHVRTYWTCYKNKNISIGNGDKRWPLTPELKAERLRHFTAMMERFAPDHITEAQKIDRIFGWESGTYLATLRFGQKLSDRVPTPAPDHECTSWISMDNLTGGKSIIMHKNRDSGRQALTLLRRAMPGKHAWIGSGAQNSFYPAQGINDRGVVVMMNSGDPHPEAENSQYGMDTIMICRILLEECGSAEAAVNLLKKIVMDNAYTHVECGSIWFIGDSKNVYIAEHNARRIAVKAVESGFAIRANAFHYPEMQIFSLRSQKDLLSHSSREFAVRDYLINRQWRRNGVVTALDNAAASRLNQAGVDGQCYPPCGKNTISATTFVIDKEYPEYLSTAYMTFSSPASTCYLPVPLTVKDIPQEILDGSFSLKSFALLDKNASLLPPDELAALEMRLYERHTAAIEKARFLLRTGTASNVPNEVANILNQAFAENFQDIRKTVK